MERCEKVELTNMCMIYDDKGNVLVQNRVHSWQGYAFPGGHVDKGESFVESTIREIKEETGLTIWNLQLCGIKQWIKNDIRNIVFLYKTNCFKGELTHNEEGENFWINYEQLLKMKEKMARNFPFTLEVFTNNNISEHQLIIEEDNFINNYK